MTGACQTARAKQFPDYRPPLIMRAIAELQVEQRIWLRNTEISGSCARESMESMLEYHPSSNHCLPRRRRRPRAYAGYAIGKGHITQGSTWWTVIRQQFVLSAKTAPRE